MANQKDSYTSPKIARSLSQQSGRKAAPVAVKMKGKKEVISFVRTVYKAHASAQNGRERYG